MTDEPNTQQQQLDVGSQPAPPTPPAEGDDARGRGRPKLAELDARKAELDAREAELAEREAELELQAAEANLALREADLEKRQASLAAAGRRDVRSGTPRSETITQPVRGRKYRGGADMPNKFHIPPDQIPDGISYQWNNHTIFGQEQHATNVYMQAQGWEAVHSSRHPHLMPPGYDGPIIIDGQILMERPQELTNEALQEELDKARGEVFLKEQQLGMAPPGQFQRERANGSNEFNQIKKNVELPEAELPRNYQYDTIGSGGAIIE